MPEALANAPPWAVALFWAAAAISGGVFFVLVPRMRQVLTRITAQPPQDPALRLVGAALGAGLDGTKLAAEAERIADALEVIAKAAATIAKLEEQGTADELARHGQILAQIVSRLDDRPRQGG